MNDTNLKF